jgi:predicted RNA-binding Zn-ribbon protein involved in translation (DUF1610 family)
MWMKGYENGRQYPAEWDKKTLPECPECGSDNMREERTHTILPGMQLVCDECGYTQEEE